MIFGISLRSLPLCLLYYKQCHKFDYHLDVVLLDNTWRVTEKSEHTTSHFNLVYFKWSEWNTMRICANVYVQQFNNKLETKPERLLVNSNSFM